ncbi:hypothetical protein [Chryseolinea lacunae]|uniref:Lipoprotein n=1 Tax=Chryseolinea lacunae TaxID=2801331 RepID=A0ABS1KMU1_9BACT|nr:hypothetical protein [Chryseolinea lacunae]MBL0740659.1 hypothetical protein [Chryseolinea lacunae]
MNTISLKQIFLIAFVLTGIFSCAKKQEDNSLTLDEYMKMGVPDPAKVWDINDFSQAYGALAKLKWDRPYQLPVKGSKKSGVLFEHMLSLKNVSFLMDSTLSLNEKAERISAFVLVCDHWIDIYSNPVIDNYYRSELIDIQIFNLRLTEKMVNLATQINNSDDPTAVVLKYGYKTIKMNYVSCLTTELKNQSHTSQFLKQDLERMADSVFASVERNREWMDSSARVDVKQSLRLVLDSTSSDHVRNKYTTLEKSL